ncbi:hypothetical protein Taro_040021 [Colocasia esculenta]|uniref:Serine hydroxymethyltransferase-like domain-containing protein n=1 Tax=Colocasia esculenta TaxID=4460 RepID=A0A843W7W2_COLES|nr:hypothetical protein [Colocasia esculenta]
MFQAPDICIFIGKNFEKVCEMCHITVNKTPIFGDNGAISPGGVRIGTPAMTTRGCLEGDFEIIAEFLLRAAQIASNVLREHGKLQKDFLKGLQNNWDLVDLRNRVESFSAQFAMPGFDILANPPLFQDDGMLPLGRRMLCRGSFRFLAPFDAWLKTSFHDYIVGAVKEASFILYCYRQIIRYHGRGGMRIRYYLQQRPSSMAQQPLTARALSPKQAGDVSSIFEGFDLTVGGYVWQFEVFVWTEGGAVEGLVLRGTKWQFGRDAGRQGFIVFLLSAPGNQFAGKAFLKTTVFFVFHNFRWGQGISLRKWNDG